MDYIALADAAPAKLSHAGLWGSVNREGAGARPQCPVQPCPKRRSEGPFHPALDEGKPEEEQRGFATQLDQESGRVQGGRTSGVSGRRNIGVIEVSYEGAWPPAGHVKRISRTGPSGRSAGRR